VIGLLGCGREEAPPPRSVKKKITIAPQKKELPPVGQTETASPVSNPDQTTSSPQGVTAGTSELVKESMQLISSYDPTGRIDPFEPLFKEQTTEQAPADKDKSKKRVPQTPLERVALSQLKLTAIIRAHSGNSALVQDASGKGYVIRTGTYIGLNSGQVVAIEKDRVVIEEEVENLMGELKIKTAELKLQKPAGEL